MPKLLFHNLDASLTMISGSVSFFPNNYFLIRSKKNPNEYILVDTGLKGDGDELISFLNDKKVKYIIISHAHYDHVQNVASIVKFFKKKGKEEENDSFVPKIVLHQLEAENSKQGFQSRFVGRKALLRFATGIGDMFKKSNVDYEAFEGDILFNSFETEKEQNLINELKNDFGVRIFHAPGHAPGHLCFQLTVAQEKEEKEEKEQEQEERKTVKRIMLCGDLLFECILSKGCLDYPQVCQDHPKEALPILNKSLRHLVQQFEFDEIYFAHFVHWNTKKDEKIILRKEDILKFLREKRVEEKKEKKEKFEEEEEGEEGEGEGEKEH